MRDEAHNARRRARRAAKRNPKSLPDPPQRDRPAKSVCGAVRKGKGLCRRTAGWGTDHPGVGRCKLHGGNSPNGIKAAAVIIGEGSILTGKTVLGIPVEMEPGDALSRCIAIAAGEVAYCSAKVHALDHSEVFETDHLGRRTLHLWIRERRKAMDRLAKFSKMALDAGLAERQVAAAEAQADLMASVIKAVMDDIDATPQQWEKLEKVLPRTLNAMEVQPSPLG